MSLVLWYAVLAAVQGALALWVILAEPRRRLNWAVGSLLILWAGSGVVFQMWREATTLASRDFLNRVGDFYEAPTFLLILLVIDGLLLRAPAPRAWKALLFAGVAALVVFVAVYVLAPLSEKPVTVTVANYAAGVAAEIAVVLFATRAANDAKRSALQRRQAALVGLAFALHVASPGAAAFAMLVRSAPFQPYSILFTPLAIASALAAVYGAARLPAPFEARGRTVARVSIGMSLFLGAASVGTFPGMVVPWARAAVLSAFAIVLAVAVLRYDLVGLRPERRKRLQSAATVLLGVCIAALVAVTAWSLAGGGALGLALGLAAVLAPVALLATPLKRLPAWMTRRVLLDPRDPEALRERVRVYASTLRAATGENGRVLAAAEPALVALRAELGLGQRDHDLLVAMGADPSAGGIVAYRLALVAAAADAEPLDSAELRVLREDLSVTERDHALVVEHIHASSDRLGAGALFLGKYHVLRRLGEGGLAEVWLARDVRGERDVVLKHLPASERRDGAALARLKRDVHASGGIEHPHVVAVLDVETVGDETVLVLEHMEGGSLADLLRAKGRLPEALVVRIAMDVLDALGALHARGIVHRDVKPANILLSEPFAVGGPAGPTEAKGRPRFVAKLGDFNIARELVSGDTVGASGERGPVGTFAYMPLEQARGLTARPQSDLYGLAATMFEALAGAPLLQLAGLSHTEAVARIAALEPPAFVPNASPGVARAVARALSRAPEDRFASAAEMRAALEAP